MNGADAFRAGPPAPGPTRQWPKSSNSVEWGQFGGAGGAAQSELRAHHMEFDFIASDGFVFIVVAYEPLVLVCMGNDFAVAFFVGMDWNYASMLVTFW